MTKPPRLQADREVGQSSLARNDRNQVNSETAQPTGVESGGQTARRLPAGVADAAFASLATFAAGLSAVNQFNDVDRGVYAIFFVAFGLGVVLPWNLILIPAEVNAVSFDVVDRIRRARDALKLGVRASLIGSLAILIAALMSRSLTGSDVIWGLTATAMITTVLSPLQDHMRRLLHIAELSWRAATVSGVQFFGVAISLGVMFLLDAPVAIMPFGSLAIANALSLMTAFVLGDVFHQKPLDEPLHFWKLAREGRWLLARAIVPSGAHFAVAAIIVGLTSPEILGYTEAARVVAQPVLVFATGLTAVLAPRSMRAAMVRDEKSAHKTRRIYLGFMLAGGIAYLAIASTDWVLNPMQYLVPAAYIVPGLVAATIAANMMNAAMYLDVNEMLGAQKAKYMAAVGLVTSPILILMALTAAATEAFSRPLGIAVRGVFQIGWYRSMLSRHYAESASDPIETLN